MQTNLAPRFQNSPVSDDIEGILRQCVHCGFCNATCPTYQLRGDELDGPRGRIYQMKQFFEGAEANADMQLHLDRCLTCRACETTCPSGVQYSRLLEIGREAIEAELPRTKSEKLKRWAITRFFNSGALFDTAIAAGRALAPLSLPKRQSPINRPPINQPKQTHNRKVLMLSGCVQPTLTPNTNAAAIQLLDHLGIEAIEIKNRHCCGALGLHTSQVEQGRNQAKKLIDYWWPYLDKGVEAIVFTASGCGVTIKDYAEIFKHDANYAERAKAISELVCDLSELVGQEIERQALPITQSKRVAFHTPCTMQHGLGLKGQVETILTAVGYEVCEVADAHLCCGSAGSYSILQPSLAKQLQSNKQRALCINAPEIIATANIGCQLHIAKGLETPVVHWVELVYGALGR